MGENSILPLEATTVEFGQRGLRAGDCETLFMGPI
jgi:hypothetical protein